MSLSFVKTDVGAPDAQLMLQELNDTLMAMLGHNGTKYVCLEEFRLDKAFFLVGYDGGTPVCCAGIRRMDDVTGEVKRVYARKNKKGIGAALMKALEEQSRETGYRRLVLECRDSNPHAISFYMRNGYTRCENYPPYEEEDDAVCLEKELV